MDPSAAIRATALLAAVGHLIFSLQLVASRRTFAPGGLLDWRLVRLRFRARRTPLVLLSGLGSDAAVVLSLALLRGAAAVAIVLAAAIDASLVAWLAILVPAALLLAARGASLTAGDRLLNIVSVALLVAVVVDRPRTSAASLIFLALVSCLAYLTAGVVKLLSADWRSGDFLTALWTTRAWGSPRTARLARQAPWLPTFAARTVIAFEITFPLLLITPPRLTVLGLLLGLGFHLGIAHMLRLNIFFWAFASTYPAIWFANRYLGS